LPEATLCKSVPDMSTDSFRVLKSLQSGMDPKHIPSKNIECGSLGPLSPYIDSYVRLLNEEGYAQASVRDHVRVIVRFSRSLQRSDCEICDLDEAVVERFLCHKPKSHLRCTPAVLRRLLARLRSIGATPPAKLPPPRTPAQRLADNYRRFLLEEQALSSRTADRLTLFIGKFISEKFDTSTLKVSELNATDVTAFVQRHAYRHSPSHARSLISAMRSFLQYLRYKGLIETDLARAVPKVALWSLSSLPKHIPAEAVQRVLNSCDQETPMGRRNYAILLLLSRLGLRAAEIVGLNLEDIDWDNALITVWGKGRQRAQLPLSAEVGQAVARYLHGDRPRCSSRRIFIRDHAPLAGLRHSHAISTIVRSSLEKAGVKSARKGAHLLRHSLATDMLQKGASLDEIGEVLRHKSPDSTAIYAKVELEALRPLGLHWPGGVK
jgi:site-specific recombinase XerD